MPRKPWKHLRCRQCGERYRKCACYAMPTSEEKRALDHALRLAREEGLRLARAKQRAANRERWLAAMAPGLEDRRREAVEAALAKLRAG